MEALKRKQAQAGTRAENEALEGVPQQTPRGQGASKTGALARPLEPADQAPDGDVNRRRGGETGGGGRGERRKENSGGTRAEQAPQEGSCTRDARKTNRTGHDREGTKRAKTAPSPSQAAGGRAKGP